MHSPLFLLETLSSRSRVDKCVYSFSVYQREWSVADCLVYVSFCKASKRLSFRKWSYHFKIPLVYHRRMQDVKTSKFLMCKFCPPCFWSKIFNVSLLLLYLNIIIITAIFPLHIAKLQHRTLQYFHSIISLVNVNPCCVHSWNKKTSPLKFK